MTYKDYLEQQGYSRNSIAHYLWQLSNYSKWCTNNKIDQKYISYGGFMKYVKHLQHKGKKAGSINNQLRSIKYYLDYLIAIDLRADNPIEGIKVKQQYTKVLNNLLDYQELEDLYYSYETDNINDFYFTATAKRNRIITGLIVYQGLQRGTLQKLELEHIELYKGKINVPGTTKSDSRTLELKSWQVIELMEYLNEYRPKIQKHINLYDETLFPLNSSNFNIILGGLIKRLKQINSKVKSVNQLRASVITHWLESHNIREVQIMAGHRYISSTEKYRQDNYKKLEEAVSMFHPLQ